MNFFYIMGCIFFLVGTVEMLRIHLLLVRMERHLSVLASTASDDHLE
jgi:hypothetical protein